MPKGIPKDGVNKGWFTSKSMIGNTNGFKKGHLSWLGKKLSLEHINNLSISHLNHKQTEETKIKIGVAGRNRKHSESSKQKIRAWHIANPSKKFEETDIERKVEKELQKMGIVYKKQHPLYGIARVDFYLPNHNSVIQCDGCYWHNCLTHHPNDHVGSRDRDERQDGALEEEGITVYRLWEHEINHPEIKYKHSISIEMVINNLIK